MRSVVMPAHNEQPYLATAVQEVVEGLRHRGEEFEVIVVENGSTDQTRRIAADLEREVPEVRCLALEAADYGRALRAGFLAARGETIVNFDVDFVDLDFLDEATKVMDAERAVIVVGSKRSPGAMDDRNPMRRLVTTVFSLLLRFGFGLRVSDTHGLKLLERKPLVDLVSACRFGADIFDTELVIRAERRGLIVTEIPVTVRDQRPPRTPILRRIPRTVLGLVQLRIALARDAMASRHQRSE